MGRWTTEGSREISRYFAVGAFAPSEPSLHALRRGGLRANISRRVVAAARRPVRSATPRSSSSGSCSAPGNLFTILSTHTRATGVDGRAGSDTLNVRTIDRATTAAGDDVVASFAIGPHTIATGNGDASDVGSRAGIGGRNFEGVLDELDALVVVIGLGRLDVDRLDVDDSGDTSANTDGVFTGVAIDDIAAKEFVRMLRILDSNTTFGADDMSTAPTRPS